MATNLVGPPQVTDSVTDGRPRIVILGAGYAGAQCARDVQKLIGNRCDLVVVDKRKASVHKMAAARAAVVGNNYSDRVLIPNDNLIEPGLGRLVHDSIVHVTELQVRLGSGIVLDYDYLVCATGSLNYSIAEPPLRYADRDSMKKFYDKVSKKIKGAERIVICGGGPVGVELAGEIKFEYPNKNVKIIHSGHRLLSKLHPPPSSTFYSELKKKVDNMGIEVLYGQKLQVNWKENGNKPYISGETEYLTDRNVKVQADLVLLCAGKKITNQFYPTEWLDELTGQMKVKRSLQLLGKNHIFAIGDLNDMPENKQGAFAARQGSIAAQNLLRCVNSQKSMVKYVPGLFGISRTFIFVTLGRKRGESYLGFISLGDGTTVRFKGKDLFTSEQWKVYNMGDKVPKEIGGASKGNKLGTVKKVPNLMVGENMQYNTKTRSIEVRKSDDRHLSVESATSLADMYKEELHNSMLKVNEDEDDGGIPGHNTQQMGYTVPNPGQFNRADVVSFVGSSDGRGESVNFQTQSAQQPAYLVPVGREEYARIQQGTLEKSNRKKKLSEQPKAKFEEKPTIKDSDF